MRLDNEPIIEEIFVKARQQRSTAHFEDYQPGYTVRSRTVEDSERACSATPFVGDTRQRSRDGACPGLRPQHFRASAIPRLSVSVR
jgi:hypothetical protein